MKYVTGGYVSEEEAGQRLAQTVTDPRCSKSGVYWSWNGGARTVGWFDFSKKQVVGAGGAGGEVFENEPSDLVRDEVNAAKLFELCDQAIAPWVRSLVIESPVACLRLRLRYPFRSLQMVVPEPPAAKAKDAALAA